MASHRYTLQVHYLPAQQLQMDLLVPLAVLTRELNCAIIGAVKEDSSHSHLQMDYLLILISDMVQDFPLKVEYGHA